MKTPSSLLEDSPYTPHEKELFLNSEEWIEEEKLRETRFSAFNEKTKPADIKITIRTGIPFQKRRAVWFFTSGGYDLLLKTGDHWDQILKSSADGESNFGCALSVFDKLHPEFSARIRTFLNALASVNRAIEFSTNNSICFRNSSSSYGRTSDFFHYSSYD